MLAELSTRKKTLGVKQSTKAIRDKRVSAVFLGRDADPALTGPIKQLCLEQDVAVYEQYTMHQLGSAGGIAVGAAVVAVLKD